jgi:hypothetical protein
VLHSVAEADPTFPRTGLFERAVVHSPDRRDVHVPGEASRGVHGAAIVAAVEASLAGTRR